MISGVCVPHQRHKHKDTHTLTRTHPHSWTVRKVSGDLITNRNGGEYEVLHEGEGRDSGEVDEVKG